MNLHKGPGIIEMPEGPLCKEDLAFKIPVGMDDLKIDQFNIFFFKEPDGEFRACTYDKPFDGISAFGDTKLEALKEFCTAMVGAIEVVEEDAKKPCQGLTYHWDPTLY